MALSYNRQADGTMAAAPMKLDRWNELLLKRGQGKTLTPEEYNELMGAQEPVEWSQERALRERFSPHASAQPKESPYDPVYQYANGITTNLGPRYKVDAQRAMSEMAVDKARFDMEQSRRQAQYQEDMQRWMFEQMRRNPYGANIRDLIYGAGGK